MKVAFRVDAGTAMGGGHLSRCLTLANALKLNGVTQCYFILKAHQGDFTEQIISDGF
jgi:spore coat polysaccharide biosynthesis predicted glycosyltransferase SpsG